MREILFKAKRTDNGEWAEGYLFDNGFSEHKKMFIGGLIIEEYCGTADDEWNITGIDFCEVDHETICQYTGLTDKNGKKIWENDLVKVRHEKYPETTNTEFDLFPTATAYTRNYAVEFINTGSNYGYRCRNRSIHFLITKNTIYNHDVEVIGNIFDNPELLDGDTD